MFFITVQAYYSRQQTDPFDLKASAVNKLKIWKKSLTKLYIVTSLVTLATFPPTAKAFSNGLTQNVKFLKIAGIFLDTETVATQIIHSCSNEKMHWPLLQGLLASQLYFCTFTCSTQLFEEEPRAKLAHMREGKKGKRYISPSVGVSREKLQQCSGEGQRESKEARALENARKKLKRKLRELTDKITLELAHSGSRHTRDTARGRKGLRARGCAGVWARPLQKDAIFIFNQNETSISVPIWVIWGKNPVRR